MPSSTPGKIRAYAASNYTADRLADALRVAADNGYRGFVALQPHYNLVHRDDYEGELADVCRTSGVSCVSYSSLADGFLTGKYRPGAALPTSERAEDATVYLNDAGLRVLRALDSVATAGQRSGRGGGAGLAAGAADGRGGDRQRPHNPAAGRPPALGGGDTLGR